MHQDPADLYDRLRIALDRADRGVVKVADELEYILTEGYAYAMGLELRARRIEKQIVEVVGDPDGTDESELTKLVREKLTIGRELGMLQQMLGRLDKRCDALPAARHYLLDDAPAVAVATEIG
ncbi:MAG: hypothetical protein QOC55_2710 [Thermoleophilaceae bacterium]|jgi:hypothetical protein|nr:hypothetical protein [Thermoleophilaceae bacterium]